MNESVILLVKLLFFMTALKVFAGDNKSGAAFGVAYTSILTDISAISRMGGKFLLVGIGGCIHCTNSQIMNTTVPLYDNEIGTDVDFELFRVKSRGIFIVPSGPLGSPGMMPRMSEGYVNGFGALSNG